MPRIAKDILNNIKRPQSMLVATLIVVIAYLLLTVSGVSSPASRSSILQLSTTTAAQIPTSPATQSTEDLMLEAINSIQIPETAPKAPDYDPLSQGKWDTLRLRTTAYCKCRICCGRHADGITADGHKIRRGDKFVASDKMFRFGREMIIPGYNNGNVVKVKDRGRVIKGYRLDLYFDSHRQAKKYGVKYLDVKIKR